MSATRRLQVGTTPATMRRVVRQYAPPPARQKSPFFLRVVATPPATVYVESVAETLVITHRARTNQAPIATGRYRR